MRDLSEMLRLARMPVQKPPMIKIGPNTFARFADLLKARSSAVGSFGGVEVREDPLLPQNMGALIGSDGEITILDFRTEEERKLSLPPPPPRVDGK